MAGLRNSNGDIVIDEHEAALDMKNIDEARAKLAEARKLLDPNKLVDSRMFGATRDEFGGLLVKICKELGERENKCNDTRNFIKAVVETYKRIDREYSERMRGN